ncbi:MAG: ParB N-terminal domain-containing protein, partial [Promethearchaeota archaeon]
MKDKLEIKYIAIKDLKKYKNNPRKNKKAVEIVAKSIKEFGFLVPLVLDNKNIIVTGHTRYKAAIKLNMKMLPCVYAENLTEKQIKAFRIMDNKTSEFADWDIDLLKEEMIELSNMDFELDLTGFSESEQSKFVTVSEHERELP